MSCLCWRCKSVEGVWVGLVVCIVVIVVAPQKPRTTELMTLILCWQQWFVFFKINWHKFILKQMRTDVIIIYDHTLTAWYQVKFILKQLSTHIIIINDHTLTAWYQVCHGFGLWYRLMVLMSVRTFVLCLCLCLCVCVSVSVFMSAHVHVYDIFVYACRLGV